MCMHIIVVRCLSTSIGYCLRALLFFPLFTLSLASFLPSSSLPFPLTFSPPSLLVRFPTSLSFHSTVPSFPTPPFFLTFPFPPISSSILFLLLFFRYLLSLLAPFPSNPLFLSYATINSTPSFFTPLFFPTTPYLHIPLFSILSILSLLSIIPLHSFLSMPPLHFFLPLHSFLSPLHIISLCSFLSLLLYLSFFSSYPSFPCSPPFLPLLHFFSPPSFLHPLLSHTLLPFLPLHSFLPYIHSFIPLL